MGTNTENQLTNESAQSIINYPILILIKGEFISDIHCGPQCTIFITKKWNIFIIGTVNGNLHSTTTTQIPLPTINEPISQIFLTMSGEIGFITSNTVFLSKTFEKIDEIEFNEFQPRENKRDRIKHICFTHNNNICFITDDGQFYKNCDENNQTFSELKKFQNTTVTSISSVYDHILVHAIPKKDDLKVTTSIVESAILNTTYTVIPNEISDLLPTSTESSTIVSTPSTTTVPVTTTTTTTIVTTHQNDKETDSDSSMPSECTVKSIVIDRESDFFNSVRRDSLKYIDRAIGLVKVEGLARKFNNQKRNEENDTTSESTIESDHHNKENMKVMKIIDVSRGEEFKCISEDGNLKKVELITDSSEEEDHTYIPNEIRYINNGVDVTDDVVKKGQTMNILKYPRSGRVAPEAEPPKTIDYFLGEKPTMFHIKPIRDMKDGKNV